MYTIYNSHTNLQFLITKAGEDAVICLDQPSSVQVNIIFSCNTTLRAIKNLIYEEFSTQRVIAELQQPRISNNVSIKPEQLLSYRKIHEIILGVVRIWPLWNSLREYLIGKVIFDSWEIFKSMSRNHNLLILHVDAYIVCDHVDVNVVNESLVLFPELLQESVEESSGNSMVPASDSSIKSLERKIIEDYNNDLGSCLICLDEFPEGSKAISMPCSHMFHSNCIKQWLRISHYCPVCRFEMPISTLIH